VTLAEQVTGSKAATNAACEPGEIVVAPGLNTGGAIASKLDPATTSLCFSTPTGEALITASTYLTGNVTPGRAQYVVLVTDGADWANTCPAPDPMLRVQQLAASGIKTFVVGFFAQEASPGGVGIAFLNDMACAGQTAKDFATACKQGATGYTAADPTSTTPLFLGAEDSAQLEGVLVGALGSLGCKLLPPGPRGAPAGSARHARLGHHLLELPQALGPRGGLGGRLLEEQGEAFLQRRGHLGDLRHTRDQDHPPHDGPHHALVEGAPQRHRHEAARLRQQHAELLLDVLPRLGVGRRRRLGDDLEQQPPRPQTEELRPGSADDPAVCLQGRRAGPDDQGQIPAGAVRNALEPVDGAEHRDPLAHPRGEGKGFPCW
jgi:hypothetical protein